jgi:alcohol dehydrogenase class IV
VAARAASLERDGMIAILSGGSAIDLAKAVAAMASSDVSTSVRDYLEGVGRGLSISSAPLPVIAIPTTAGTGSEATKNAVVSSYDPPFKKSLRSDRMMPRVVMCDIVESTRTTCSSLR